MPIIEITSLEEMFELLEEKEEQPMREEIIGEELIRKYIRKKIKSMMQEQQKAVIKEELRLRKAIRQILNEGDISDIHPHRSTGINVLEDVLKKMITTLRTDYKRMTTSKSQRDSFRAHMISAIKKSLAPSIKKSLAPSLVNDTYLQGTDALMAEPTPEFNVATDTETYGTETTGPIETASDVKAAAEDEELLDTLDQLDEAEIEIGVEDEEKKIPVEADDEPDEISQFSGELTGLDETGRNMAFTTYKKISQYILDAYDTLANPEDKKIFIDYLITNMKLYFDKFEDELQKEVSEPSTSQYDSMK
jgi:hypothetical protein